MRQLYVSDMASNGTNDLLVVEGGEVIACLEEATFGVSVHIAPGTQAIVPFTEGLVSAIDDVAPGEACTVLRRVDLETLSSSMAVSPVRSRDAAEARMLGFLNQHGVI